MIDELLEIALLFLFLVIEEFKRYEGQSLDLAVQGSVTIQLEVDLQRVENSSRVFEE